MRSLGRLFITVLPAICMFAAEPAKAVTIDFDTDAFGNPITAPNGFGDTSPLTTLYSSLGVTFSGPSPGTGGAILNDSTWGYPAYSGDNILGFNPATYATFPETLLFAPLADYVESYMSSSTGVDTVLMQAFDASDILVAATSASSSGWVRLDLSWPQGISRIVLDRTAGSMGTMFDNLFFTTIPTSTIPEPASLALLALGGLGVLARTRGRERRRWKNAVRPQELALKGEMA